MQEQLLTARVLYRFLCTGVGTPSAPVPFLNKSFHVTQSEFWWCFFSEGIPEPVLIRYFYTGNGRSRALSNLMNRTVSHSMPSALYKAMEENLDPGSLLHITVWLSTVMDENMNPLTIHQALSDLEDRVCRSGMDLEFMALSDFFRGLRPVVEKEDMVNMKKLYMHALLRFALLAFHAVYGDQMLTSPALARLRSCRYCDPEIFWKATLETTPRMKENGFSFLRAVRANQQAEKEPARSGTDSTDLLKWMNALAHSALPSAKVLEEHTGPNAGWYVVANWLDICVNVNDTPYATYDGAKELGTVPNGTLLYVLSAPGYQGLHVSFGVWGKIIWKNTIAWVPMNLLVRIHPGESYAEG